MYTVQLATNKQVTRGHIGGHYLYGYEAWVLVDAYAYSEAMSVRCEDQKPSGSQNACINVMIEVLRDCGMLSHRSPSHAVSVLEVHNETVQRRR